MPSSLSSNSHRLLTALVDSRHRKVYKVKNCITDIDPEREKEEKEKVIGYLRLQWHVFGFLCHDIQFLLSIWFLQAESQTIRANVLLNRKREKVSRKYTPTVERRRQLSPAFLEDALDEVFTCHVLFPYMFMQYVILCLLCSIVCDFDAIKYSHCAQTICF